jgi:hypothetical protein
VSDHLVIIHNLSSDPAATLGVFDQGSSVTMNFNGTDWQFQIAYHADIDHGPFSLTGGNDVVLYNAVPEPHVLGLAVALLTLHSRRRQWIA